MMMICINVEYNIDFHDWVQDPVRPGHSITGACHHSDTVLWGHFVDDPTAPGVIERIAQNVRNQIWGNAPLNFKNETWGGRQCVYTGATIKGYGSVELDIPVRQS